ncbi:hypothetical protein M422DRAFT_780328 [Sphaerobolus stellatus SS14]|uniref:Uncharacterized protein n=1 Tax=Sphaerobolus stellatus (strain SS14) TaxID=990650 RepID=A0A0C9VTJ2_SPHS4|nr:hypothetical protein M422DRAFT_780328 [Sphaerobolus stellatus SS14]
MNLEGSFQVSVSAGTTSWPAETWSFEQGQMTFKFKAPGPQTRIRRKYSPSANRANLPPQSVPARPDTSSQILIGTQSYPSVEDVEEKSLTTPDSISAPLPLGTPRLASPTVEYDVLARIKSKSFPYPQREHEVLVYASQALHDPSDELNVGGNPKIQVDMFRDSENWFSLPNGSALLKPICDNAQNAYDGQRTSIRSASVLAKAETGPIHYLGVEENSFSRSPTTFATPDLVYSPEPQKPYLPISASSSSNRPNYGDTVPEAYTDNIPMKEALQHRSAREAEKLTYNLAHAPERPAASSVSTVRNESNVIDAVQRGRNRLQDAMLSGVEEKKWTAIANHFNGT